MENSAAKVQAHPPYSQQPHPTSSSSGKGGEKRKLCDNTVFGVTKSESVKGSLSWKIVRFKDLDKRVGEYCESPEFTVGDYKWSLFLYPNGSKDDAKNYISIFLSCLNIFHEVTINFTVTFLSQNTTICGDKILGPIKKTFGEDELDWGWSKALDHQAMNMCFLAEEEGTLYVRCDVEVFGEWRTTLDNVDHTENETVINIPDCTVAADFEKLFLEHPHSDVVFIVGDEQFAAHKGILSVRSSVFRGMFASDMREGREGVVCVQEVEPAVFRELLRFIYTGGCTKLIEEKPCDLLTVADKYDLPRLKLMCEDILLRRLNMQNAPATLSHADMYHATQLKKSILEFIANRFFEVIATDGFKEWTLENPHLVSEIHEYMAHKMGTKQDTPSSSGSSQSKSKKNSQKRRRTST